MFLILIDICLQILFFLFCTSSATGESGLSYIQISFWFNIFFYRNGFIPFITHWLVGFWNFFLPIGLVSIFGRNFFN